jgi:hypothetical protein
MLTQSNLHDPGQLVLYGYASLVVVRGEMKLILALSNPATQADVLRDLLSGTDMTVVALSGKIGLETDTLVEAALDLPDYNWVSRPVLKFHWPTHPMEGSVLPRIRAAELLNISRHILYLCGFQRRYLELIFNTTPLKLILYSIRSTIFCSGL